MELALLAVFAGYIIFDYISERQVRQRLDILEGAVALLIMESDGILDEEEFEDYAFGLTSDSEA